MNVPFTGAHRPKSAIPDTTISNYRLSVTLGHLCTAHDALSRAMAEIPVTSADPLAITIVRESLVAACIVERLQRLAARRLPTGGEA